MSEREKAECIEAINSTAELIQEMLELLESDAPDTPMAFLEIAQDAQYQINRAVAAALRPILMG